MFSKMEISDTSSRSFTQHLLYLFGYLTGYVLVRVLSLGLIKVEKLTDNPHVSATGWIEPPKRNEIGSQVGTIFGLLFWMIIAVAWAAAT